MTIALTATLVGACSKKSDEKSTPAPQPDPYASEQIEGKLDGQSVRFGQGHFKEGTNGKKDFIFELEGKDVACGGDYSGTTLQ